MRILYYLEPYQERADPLFRFATVRHHLDREIRGLMQSPLGDVQIVMLCSERVAAAIRAHAFLPAIRLVTVSQQELERIYPSYFEAAAHWYNRDFRTEHLERMMELCADKLRSFEPDVIVCYESNAPFLEELFPDALLLHNTLGIFSRAPFPETSALDPFGIGKDSFLARFGQRLRERALSAEQQRQLDLLKEAYQDAQLRHSPVRRADVRGDFERVVMLPLQVSRYFMYDENCPPLLKGGSQLDLVRHVLAATDPKIGVYVTMHGAEAALFTPGVLKELTRRFPNLLFSEAVQRIRWPSQHVLPHVDAVVTVSSAVGLQALIWDVPVVVLGRSHLTGIASGTSLADLPALFGATEGGRFDPALYHLLTHYYPLMDRYHHRGDWFAAFLERGIARKRSGLDVDFFAPIDAPENVFSALQQELRVEQYVTELSKVAPIAIAPAPSGGDQIRSIAGADLVSFDVFDTLVTRPLIHPRAVFDLVAPKAGALFAARGVQAPRQFRALREEAARQAAAQARSRGREEYSLLAVYELLCARLGAPLAIAAELKQLEEEVERAIHVPRESGRRLFQEALARKKRTVLISDMFLEPDVVAAVLQRCGYAGYDRLYVSSEFGLLKRTGRLYAEVRKLEGNPRTWVHFGDSRFVDVRAAVRQGVRGQHLQNISELYAVEPHFRVLRQGRAAVSPARDAEEMGQSAGAALMHGVISRKFYDRPAQAERSSRFEGSAYRLGYEAGGPLLLAFVMWLVTKARRDGLTDLYFLARDGYLPKQIFELISAGQAGVPRAHYLYASRRAYGVAALRSPEDVAGSLEFSAGRVKLSLLLRSRFGLEPEQLARDVLTQMQFGSWDDFVDVADAAVLERLKRALALNADPILARAAEERADLEAYLRSEGLFDPERSAGVVDIGHHASLQVALARLTDRRDLKGYYFATFYPALAVYRQGLELDSYLLEFEDSKASDHVYCRNVGLFEFLFLPPLPSLERVRRRRDGTFEPIFVEGDESRRFRVVEEVHRGVLDFCRDVVAASAGQASLFDISKNEALRAFAEFAASPDPEDAALLDGVGFVDAFGGFPLRYLIAGPLFESVNALNFAEYERSSWWKPGARAAAKRAGRAGPIRGSMSWERKLRKFWRDPRRFVSDMKLAKSVRDLWARPRERG